MSLGTGVFLRNQNRKPVASCTTIYTGTGKQVALNGSGSEDPEGFSIKEYHWFLDGSTTPMTDVKGVVGVWNGRLRIPLVRARGPGSGRTQVRQTNCGSVVVP